MDQKAIFLFCKQLGCCDLCGFRYLGIRNQSAYEKPKGFIKECNFEEIDINATATLETEENSVAGADSTNNEEPQSKKRKLNICVSCLGILQENTWKECNEKVKEVLDKKQYVSSTMACALSAPIATMLREKVISLRIHDKFKDYDEDILTPLKEAWKWSFGPQLATYVNKVLDSGAISPLLVTLNLEYPDELQELEILKTLSPALFASRSQQRRRFTVEFTRRSVEQALEAVSVESLAAVPRWGGGLPEVGTPVGCVSVVCTHAPLYLGGRYIKKCRDLPQTPWLVQGKRMMESSVQEIIFEPLAKAYGMSEAEAESRLKFMSAGREDVDVRCLGDGRPFAIEITDPRRELTEEELAQVCEQISKSGKVEVKLLVYVSKEELVNLKKGEQEKYKTYEVLCIKLQHSKYEQDKSPDSPVTVTEEDLSRLGDDWFEIKQKTPIRVLHRRPLLTRVRKLRVLNSTLVPGQPRVFAVRVQSAAGAYVKEAAGGELARTEHSLAERLAAPLDVLALDVAQVHLHWPSRQCSAQTDLAEC